MLNLIEKSLLDDRDGGWSAWSLWSICNRQCGGGLRWRRRDCSNPAPMGHGLDCPGHAMEGQECNAHSCKGKDDQYVLRLNQFV